MRQPVDRARLFALIRALARATRTPTQVFLVGGSSAVTEGWRDSTIDVDLLLEPENDQMLRAVPSLKNELSINVELASPSDFIPEVPGWRDRSRFVEQIDSLTVRHYDFVAQSLAKIERGHDRDREDVRQMLRRGLVTASDLRQSFEAIAGQLHRFPAIDPSGFRSRLERALADDKS